MQAFAEIYQRAVANKGGEAELEGLLPKPRSAAYLRKLPADRYLAEMARCVFRSGFVWRVVENKWPGFEEAFNNFDPVACAYQPDEAMDSLAQDTRIIRHYKKILSVRANASFMLDIEAEHGSFGKFIAAWPVDDIIGLHAVLKKNGSRLGGNTGPMFLRMVGKDTFLMYRDVVTALMQVGVVDKKPSSKRQLQQVQDAFNAWRVESDRPLCQLSRILSCSVPG